MLQGVWFGAGPYGQVVKASDDYQWENTPVFHLRYKNQEEDGKNLEPIFELTDLETFIPEYLFLPVFLKEYIRSGRTCCVILPTPEEGKKPKQKPPKSRTKPKHSPCSSFF